MSTAYELAHGRERLRSLIEFAIREGWQVRQAKNGRIVFRKSSGAVFYTGTTVSVGQTIPVAGEIGHG